DLQRTRAHRTHEMVAPDPRQPHRRAIGILRLMYVVERYAQWAADWRSQPVAPEVLHHARRAVIDWHAALLPGSVVAPATLLKRALGEDGDARTLALINGSAAHTVEVDDIYREGIYHPGAPTVAAAHAL